jgi:hypothetical protein
MEIEVILGMVFEVIFGFLDFGHGKRGTEEAGRWYGFGTKNKVDFCGTNLVL